jgi:hypothetical protein
MLFDRMQPVEHVGWRKRRRDEYCGIGVTPCGRAQRWTGYDAGVGKNVNFRHFQRLDCGGNDASGITGKRMALVGANTDEVEGRAQISSTSRP